jgi:hypothetical protein
MAQHATTNPVQARHDGHVAAEWQRQETVSTVTRGSRGRRPWEEGCDRLEAVSVPVLRSNGQDPGLQMTEIAFPGR